MDVQTSLDQQFSKEHITFSAKEAVKNATEAEDADKDNPGYEERIANANTTVCQSDDEINDPDPEAAI